MANNKFNLHEWIGKGNKSLLKEEDFDDVLGQGKFGLAVDNDFDSVSSGEPQNADKCEVQKQKIIDYLAKNEQYFVKLYNKVKSYERKVNAYQDANDGLTRDEWEEVDGMLPGLLSLAKVAKLKMICNKYWTMGCGDAGKVAASYFRGRGLDHMVPPMSEGEVEVNESKYMRAFARTLGFIREEEVKEEEHLQENPVKDIKRLVNIFRDHGITDRSFFVAIHDYIFGKGHHRRKGGKKDGNSVDRLIDDLFEGKDK